MELEIATAMAIDARCLAGRSRRVAAEKTSEESAGRN